MLVGVADVVMIGQLGAVPLAAASVGHSLFTIPLIVALGFSHGLTPLVSQAQGSGNTTSLSHYLRHSLFLNSVLACVLMGGCFLVSSYMHVLGQPLEVETQVVPYFLILASSLLPMMIFQSFKQFAEGFALTRQAMFIALLANGVNILLNYVLIYGKWGFPAFGIEGAGIATWIARLLMAVGMVVLTVQHPILKQYARQLLQRVWCHHYAIHLMKLGIPISLQMFFEIAAFSSATILMGWIGTEAIAAHQIAINMASITYMIATGLAAAATVRVGFFVGRGQSSSILKAGHAAYLLVLFYMGVCALVFIALRHWLPSLYIHDKAVEIQAAGLLMIAALFQLSDGAQVVGLGALRGMKDVKIPTMITLMAYWVVGLPVGYVFAFEWSMGAAGIWYGLLIGLTVAACLLYLRFRMQIKNETIER